MRDQLARLLEPVLRRIAALAVRGVVTRVDDSKRMQTVQLTCLRGETLSDVERPQPYGLSGVPEVGAEAIALCLGGSREHAIAAVVDDRNYRPRNQAAGEVQLYSRHGQRVHLKADGSVDVQSGSAIKLTVGSTSIEVTSAGVTITSPGGTTTFQ